jgi:hypothetical protein
MERYSSYGIDKKLMYYKQSDGTFKGLSKEYVKKYNRSISFW